MGNVEYFTRNAIAREAISRVTCIFKLVYRSLLLSYTVQPISNFFRGYVAVYLIPDLVQHAVCDIATIVVMKNNKPEKITINQKK